MFDCSIFRAAIHDGLRVVGYPKISQWIWCGDWFWTRQSEEPEIWEVDLRMSFRNRKVIQKGWMFLVNLYDSLLQGNQHMIERSWGDMLIVIWKVSWFGVQGCFQLSFLCWPNWQRIIRNPQKLLEQCQTLVNTYRMVRSSDVCWFINPMNTSSLHLPSTIRQNHRIQPH